MYIGLTLYTVDRALNPRLGKAMNGMSREQEVIALLGIEPKSNSTAKTDEDE
jgi:hypothetical protein